jgi:hypothetical protein
MTGKLWAGVLLGPSAWLADLALSYALVPARHGDGTLGQRLAVAAAALAITLAGGFISLRNWRRLRAAQDPDDGNGPRFLALFGAVASAFFALVIATTTVPNLVLRPNATPSQNQSAFP